MLKVSCHLSSVSEIKMAIRKLRNNKTVGVDAIPADILGAYNKVTAGRKAIDILNESHRR